MDRLHAYEERTGKYLGYFKQNIDGAKIVVDVGCGIGAFSKALACGKRLVTAIDIEEVSLERSKTHVLKGYMRMPTISLFVMAG